MPKVIFQIEGAGSVEIACNPGDNLLELARRANVAIDAPCSGNGSCGKCKVKLLEGQLESIPSRHISEAEYAEGWRLSCNSKVIGDCTVLVPDIASAYKSRMRTADLSSPKEIAIFEHTKEELLNSGIEFVNDLLALDIVMEAPTLDDTMPDNERLTWGIQSQLEVEHVKRGRGCLVCDTNDGIKKLQEYQKNLHLLFVLDKFDNLVKNGRMSKLTAIVATCLYIKPLCVAEEGEIKVYEKPRTMKGALNKLIESIEKNTKTNKISQKIKQPKGLFYFIKILFSLFIVF